MVADGAIVRCATINVECHVTKYLFIFKSV